jgi:hypothetical protein
MKKISLISLAVVLLCFCSLAFAGLTPNNASHKVMSVTTPQQPAPELPKVTAVPNVSNIGPVATQINKIYTGAVEPVKSDQIAKTGGATPPPVDHNLILQGGDNFGTATVISALPYSDAGTTAGYAHDYDPSCVYTGGISPDVVYSYAPAGGGTMTVSLCGSSFDTGIAVYRNDAGTMVACNDDYCGVQSQVDDVPIAAGNTYYLVVTGYNGYSGAYTINVTPGNAPPSADFSVVAPGSWSNTTCGAGNDCSLRASEEHIYEVVIPTAGPWVFSLCGTAVTWDSYMYLGTSPCASDIAYSDDYCGALSEITANIAAGTYYVTIEGYGSTSCGDYVLDISGFVPCDIICPPEAIPEGEVACYDEYVDDYNGGCNSTPAVFQDIAIGDAMCGTSGDFLFQGSQYRDTDWYRITVTDRGTLTWKAVGEFPMLVFIISDPAGDCVMSFPASGTAAPCDTAVASAVINPGNYYLWVGPSAFTGYPCPLEYYAYSTFVVAEPCILTCPAGGIPENEPVCTDEYVDVTNGGCNSTPNVFGVVNPGETICGTSGTFLFSGSQYRDTDWFTLHLDAPKLVTITGKAEFDFLMFLMSGTCASYTTLGSATAAPCSTLTIPAVRVAAGDYMVWAGPSVFAGWECGVDYYFTVTTEDPPPPPANDLCVNAEPLTVPASVTASTAAAYVDSDFPTCGTNITAPGVWYSVPGTGNTITVSTCNAVTTYDSKISVYCNTCAQPVCVGGNDDNCATYGLRSSFSFCSDVTNTYLILVHGFSAATGTFQLDVTDDGVPCSNPASCTYVPPPANDVCDNVTPVPLSVGIPIQFLGDNTGATTNGDCASFSSYPNVWEAFTTTECMDITLDFCGTPGPWQNGWLNLATDCFCTSTLSVFSWDQTTCTDGNITMVFAGVQPGTYYYPILNDPSNFAIGPYVINVSGVACPPPPPDPCDGAAYTNGSYDPAGAGYGTQCDPVYPFAAGVADDFVLPGSGTIDIASVACWMQFWNHSPLGTPNDLTGIVVTIYADNAGSPGGKPTNGDPNCAHEELVTGGIISSEFVNPGDYTFVQTPEGFWQIVIPITPVTLDQNVTYWLEVAPVLDFSLAGQTGWVTTPGLTGSSCLQIFELLGITTWTAPAAVDMAFCLLPVTGPSNCQYVPGDINGNGTTNGIDVTYGVGFFKGGALPPVNCGTPIGPCPQPISFYAAGDVNGSCVFNGIDITYFVGYLQGTQPGLLFCPSCPPQE